MCCLSSPVTCHLYCVRGASHAHKFISLSPSTGCRGKTHALVSFNTCWLYFFLIIYIRIYYTMSFRLLLFLFRVIMYGSVSLSVRISIYLSYLSLSVSGSGGLRPDHRTKMHRIGFFSGVKQNIFLIVSGKRRN